MGIFKDLQISAFIYYFNELPVNSTYRPSTFCDPNVHKMIVRKMINKGNIVKGKKDNGGQLYIKKSNITWWR